MIWQWRVHPPKSTPDGQLFRVLGWCYRILIHKGLLAPTIPSLQSGQNRKERQYRQKHVGARDTTGTLWTEAGIFTDLLCGLLCECQGPARTGCPKRRSWMCSERRQQERCLIWHSTRGVLHVYRDICRISVPAMKDWIAENGKSRKMSVWETPS